MTYSVLVKFYFSSNSEIQDSARDVEMAIVAFDQSESPVSQSQAHCQCQCQQ